MYIGNNMNQINPKPTNPNHKLTDTSTLNHYNHPFPLKSPFLGLTLLDKGPLTVTPL